MPSISSKSNRSASSYRCCPLGCRRNFHKTSTFLTHMITEHFNDHELVELCINVDELIEAREAEAQQAQQDRTIPPRRSMAPIQEMDEETPQTLPPRRFKAPNNEPSGDIPKEPSQMDQLLAMVAGMSSSMSALTVRMDGYEGKQKVPGAF